MRRFLRDIALFLPLAACVYAAAVVAWGSISDLGTPSNLFYRRGAYGHTHTRLAEAKSAGPVDVLVVGSSHAYRGVDPRELAREGYTSFNLGTSAQTPPQTLLLLGRYLDSLSPRVLVYEVYPPALDFDARESALDIISNDRNDLASWRMAWRLRDARVLNTLIYATFRDLLGLNDGFAEPPVKDADTYITGGYSQISWGPVAAKPHPSQSYAMTPGRLAQVAQVARMARDRGIRPVLVYAPVTRTLYDSYLNNSQFADAMRQIAPYYDYNRLTTLGDSLLFYDDGHLTRRGAALFTQALAQTLKAIDAEAGAE